MGTVDTHTHSHMNLHEESFTEEEAPALEKCYLGLSGVKKETTPKLAYVVEGNLLVHATEKSRSRFFML